MELTRSGNLTDLPLLRAEQLRKAYVKAEMEIPACENISFSVNQGEFVCIVGPSGCGKTTLLKCICHLLEPTAGKVFINDLEVHRPPKEMILIFQDYSRSLFPWLTVIKNVLFVLKKKDLRKEEKSEIAMSALASVNLAGWFAKASAVEKNKDKIERFIRAINKATDFINRNPHLLPEIVGNNTRVKADLARKVTLPKFFTAIYKSDIQKQIDLCAKHGLLKKGFDANEIVTDLIPLR